VTLDPQHRRDLLDTVHAAQLVAGVLSARHRGSPDDAATLMAQATPHQLAGGAMLLAELSLALYARESGQDLQSCITALCLDLESAVAIS
jgi:hypothetical protein